MVISFLKTMELIKKHLQEEKLNVELIMERQT
jgi:hypothetical protein